MRTLNQDITGVRITEAEETLLQVVRMLLAYLQENQAGVNTPYSRADVLQEKLDLRLPEQGASLSELLPTIEAYLRYSTRTGSPNFFNLLFAGFEPTGLLSDMVTSVTNTTMHTYEAAPVATLMELTLIDALNRLVGFPQGEGIMTTGGSNANAIAMLCARHRVLPEAKQSGLNGCRLVAFVSDQAHYSFLKAAIQLGIGTDNVVKVETDESGRMLPQKLAAAIAQSLEAGKTPFFVGATAGTTVLGAFDPLAAIAEITRSYGLWLHVDAAWGCAVLFSRRHQHLLAGSELADSFTWDAHKLMGVPVVCSAVLVKQKGTLSTACAGGGTEYLFHDDEDAAYDLGRMSLVCGRRVDALKLWLAWQHYGSSGYEARVDRLLRLAEYALKWVQTCERLKLVAPAQFLNICFRYTPLGPEPCADLDRLNRAIRDRLLRSGQAHINHAQHRGQTIIRLVLANPDVQEADLDRLFHNIMAAGEACEAED